MTRKFCDKCRKQISTNPLASCQNPLFEIRQINPPGLVPIDLCEDCSKKFILWVTGGEEA